MRRRGEYRAPSFVDPNDLRLVKIIAQGARASPDAVNILGVPYDGAVLGRKGAAEGPPAIRRAMGGFSNYSVEKGVGLKDAKVVDLGDLMGLPGEVADAHSEIQKEVSKELRKESLLVLLGGDNSVSLPGIRALGEKFGRIGLVVLDSHLDLRGRINGRPTSGSAYGLALEEVPGLDPRRVVEIGAHGFLHSETYVRKAEKIGVRLVTTEEVTRKGTMRVAQEAYEAASHSAEAVYLSIDLDAIDFGEVSGVSAPSSGGMTSREVLDIAFRVALGPKVRCADIVELAPSLDLTGKSSVVAASVLVSLVGAFVSGHHA